MPAFVRLSKDDMYRVRRACAESLFEISKNVGDDIRLGVLVEIFLRLSHDPSKLVKQSVLQQSGMFISTLPPRAVSDTILSQYCSLISSPTGDASADNDLKHICAFTFPAVLSVIGPKRWKDVREVKSRC
jgi:serine/threonine-protein phosphatase 4 regulatory subunit 1